MGILISLTIVELSRFYGFPELSQPARIALVLSFLLLASAFISTWTWRRFAVIFLVLTAVCAFPYFAYRPEMFRDDVLERLENPALSADLLLYRGFVLRTDPDRALKIERLQFMYGLLRSYGVRPAKVAPTTTETQ